MHEAAQEAVQVPLSWMLSIIFGLAGVVATLAGIIYTSLSSRIAAQEKTIEGLRADIERLSKGCGIEGCLWRSR